MRRYAFLILLAMLVGCGKSEQRLNVLTFPEYLDPKVLQAFEERYHCKVVLDFFDSGDSGASKIANGGDSVYDIVGGLGDVRGLSRQGLLLPLHKERIPNLTNIDPQFTGICFDEGVQYSVPYIWGTTGLYVRKNKNRTIDESWSLVFDASKQLGSFYLINESRTCLGAALRYKGYSVNSTNRNELTQARDLLIDAKKRSLGFIDGTSSKNRNLTRAADATMAWGDCIAGEVEDTETHYFMPREGAAMILDGFAILAKSQHRELAENFINYLLDAKIAAQTAEFLNGPTPNKAALPFINPVKLKNPSIYPPPDQMSRLEMVKDVGEFSKLYDEIWTQIKAQ